jgi:hypothetical protein
MKTTTLFSMLCILGLFNCSTIVFAQKMNIAFAEPVLQIIQIEPTVFFPKPAEGKPLKQLIRVHVDNPGGPASLIAKVTTGKYGSDMQPLDNIVSGKSTVSVLVPDIMEKTQVTIDLLTKDGKLLASQKADLLPQKKWTFYSVSYSHQDLGFGDYPSRLRTSIRHENIRIPLQFCRETDDWPEDSKYRFNIETSEPLTSFISFNGKEAARELARRMGEGRIQLMGLHNTASTEELSHELMARLFYMTGRHAVDILGVPAGKTIQQTDVIGLSWPVATYAKEAGFDYCFHGFNGNAMRNSVDGRWTCEMEDVDPEKGTHVFSIGNEPNFYWQGPDGQTVLRRATTYSRNSLLHDTYELNPVAVQDPARIEMLVRGHEGMNWPFGVMLSQDGADFILTRRTIADRAVKWNAEYSYPRIICTTYDEYFKAIEKEIAEKNIKLSTIAADENNQWSDQDYAAARWSGIGRKLGEALPATEILNSMAQVLVGGNDQWQNLFQGYHRLLQYFEHTNAKQRPSGNMVWCETEVEENREMVKEAGFYQQAAFSSASKRLNEVISRKGKRNIVVFNPLSRSRTDLVKTEIPAGMILVDGSTGEKMPVQLLPDGSGVFIAREVPATGYKVFRLEPERVKKPTVSPMLETENRFYKIKINGETGALLSLFDKGQGVELIDTNSPHAFNEYLYEFRTLMADGNYDSKWSRMQKAESVKLEHGPLADVLTVSGKAEGVLEMRQTVIFYHDLPRIDFGIWMNKAPFKGNYREQHEAVFVALPFSVPEFSIHHELPGGVAEPYRQQVEGSATCHYAIRSFTDLSNAKYGITVSPTEGSLVCYGEPISTPFNGDESLFKRDRTYPTKSRLYMYLMNNMFDCNIASDQQGPVSFQWSVQSHAGDWKSGEADKFGREVLQPLIAWRADGKNKGSLKSSGSFMSVDVPNVMCSSVKAAEMNGDGFIVRLNETRGRETTAVVTLPMLPEIKSVRMVTLVENDTKEELPVKNNSFSIKMPKFGVKTVRVLCEPASLMVTDLQAKPVADMQVELVWGCQGEGVSHYNLYRDTLPECESSMLNFIGQSAVPAFSDVPSPNIGGWIRSCLTPATKYYYRVIAVDMVNNRIGNGEVVEATTPSSTGKNLPPVAVEGVRPILVSPINIDNCINLLFRTSCEPDVKQYEVYRSTVSGFVAGTNTLTGIVKSDEIPPRSGGYGESAIQYQTRDYDHAMFTDRAVEADTEYYYKVCAVDAAGQKGAFSEEVSIRTKVSWMPKGLKADAQSVYAPEFAPEFAMDGVSDQYHSWASKPYGGGTKEKPNEVRLSIELPKALALNGFKVVGDIRPEVAQITTFKWQMRIGGEWKNDAEIKGAKGGEAVVVRLDAPVTADGLRLIFPAGDLPAHTDPVQDGIARVCELMLILENGNEVLVPDLFKK